MSYVSSNEVRIPLLRRNLKKMGAKVEEGRKGSGVRLVVHYQSGVFLLLCGEEAHVQLLMPNIYSSPADSLNLVRDLCNKCNQNSTDASRITYLVNEKTHEVDVSVIYSFRVPSRGVQEILEDAFRSEFVARDTFTQQMNTLRTMTPKSKNFDLERNQMDFDREMFMLKELEMIDQKELDGAIPGNGRTSTTSPMTIKRMMAELFNLKQFQPVTLTLRTPDATEIISKNDEIMSIDFCRLLIRDNAFCAHELSFVLEYVDLTRIQQTRIMSCIITTEEATKDTLYYRITMTLVPMTLSHEVKADSYDRDPYVNSALYAYDLRPHEKEIAELNYIWKDTVAKVRNGEVKALTDEQRFIMGTQQEDIVSYALKGRRLFLDGCYAQAIDYLNEAYDRLQEEFDNLSNDELEMFYEVCYMLGFCFSKLFDYKTSFFYLNIVFSLRRLTYIELFVDNMVNSNDFRAMSIIDSLMQEYHNAAPQTNNNDADGDFDDDEDDDFEVNSAEERAYEANAQQLLRFLNRRRTTVLLNQGRTKEAEQKLKEMLSDPYNSDFALKELAQLQRSKRKNGITQPSGLTPPSSLTPPSPKERDA